MLHQIYCLSSEVAGHVGNFLERCFEWSCGRYELVWQKRHDVFSELKTAKNSLGTEAATAYMATDFVIFFPL